MVRMFMQDREEDREEERIAGSGIESSAPQQNQNEKRDPHPEARTEDREPKAGIPKERERVKGKRFEE